MDIANVTEIHSAILNHQSLPSTMQMIAEAFVGLCPSKGVAIFLLSGPQFRVEAEAGLPQRSPRALPSPPAASDLREAPLADFPALRQILDTGVKLCQATPLFCASGEAKGTFTVFDRRQEVLDDSTRETVESLCGLACLAIEHGQLYEEAVQRSEFDSVTGLVNRHLLENQLRQGMATALRQCTLLGACCIELDHFKQINDYLGPKLGDAFLKQVAARLKRSIGKSDTVVRRGGDDFVLILHDLAQPSDAADIGQRLLNDLSAPVLLEGHSLAITSSIGVSLFPSHGDTADLLLRNADAALEGAKRAGASRVQLYSPALGRQSRRAADMVDALLSAVSHDQFRMAYQPIFTIDKQIVGFEALLRWRHPVWGHISPPEFIPTAERTGLIVAIGDWVIDEVCRQAMEWNAAGLCPVRLFANVSGVQLERPDFAFKIADALARSGLAPERLELEITESWVISDLRSAARKLRKLRDLGIGIAIDDFGTGYSSFNYLQELPLDTLKIDRSFVERLDGSAANLATVRGIAALAQQLGLRTVAEGVQSELQIRQLAEVGCEFFQGFFLARPLPPEAACSLLKNLESSPLPTKCLTH